MVDLVYVYRYPSADGTLAALVAYWYERRSHPGSKPLFIAMSDNHSLEEYNAILAEIGRDKLVYMLGISGHPFFMKALCLQSLHVVVIEHRSSTMAMINSVDLNENLTVKFSDANSTSMTMYKIFNGKENMLHLDVLFYMIEDNEFNRGLVSLSEALIFSFFNKFGDLNVKNNPNLFVDIFDTQYSSLRKEAEQMHVIIKNIIKRVLPSQSFNRLHYKKEGQKKYLDCQALTIDLKTTPTYVVALKSICNALASIYSMDAGIIFVLNSGLYNSSYDKVVVMIMSHSSEDIGIIAKQHGVWGDKNFAVFVIDKISVLFQ